MQAGLIYSMIRLKRKKDWPRNMAEMGKKKEEKMQ